MESIQQAEKETICKARSKKGEKKSINEMQKKIDEIIENHYERVKIMIHGISTFLYAPLADEVAKTYSELPAN